MFTLAAFSCSRGETRTALKDTVLSRHIPGARAQPAGAEPVQPRHLNVTWLARGPWRAHIQHTYNHLVWLNHLAWQSFTTPRSYFTTHIITYTFTPLKVKTNRITSHIHPTNPKRLIPLLSCTFTHIATRVSDFGVWTYSPRFQARSEVSTGHVRFLLCVCSAPWAATCRTAMSRTGN